MQTFFQFWLISELYSDAVIGTEALNLQYAIQHVCYYMALNSSWRGRFNCIDGWFDFDIIKSADDYCSGIVNGHTLSVTYSFYRKPGADAVIKKLGDGYKVGDWSMTNNGTHWTATYDTGHQVIWAGANDFQVAQAGQATGGGPTCAMTVTWSGTVITCATWGTNQGTTVTGKYIYQE